MVGIVKIEIKESITELLEQLKLVENQEVKERIQALYWLKSGQVQSTVEIARLTGKHRTTVSRWLSSYRQGGILALLNKGKSSGRTRKIPPEIMDKLKQKLQTPSGFSSYKEVQMWLKEVASIEYSYRGIHQIVRYQLKAKLKVPRPVHVKQDIGAVEEFKKN